MPRSNRIERPRSITIQEPSPRRVQQQAGQRPRLAEQGVGVEFLLTDAHAQDVEAGLRATLLHAFGGSVRNVFASVQGPKASIWIEPKHQLAEDELSAIKNRASKFLDEVGVRLEFLTTTVDENLPSVYLCLRVIRQHAPIDPLKLTELLRVRGFVIPSDDWLLRRLDAMRRSGRLVRQDGGRYSLTLAALRDLGTVKGRSSPDISRLLALARRGR